MLLAVLLSLLIGITLGLLGGGGSILTVPILVYALHVEPKNAIATSLLVVGVTSFMAMLQHARRGAVRWRVGLVFGVSGMGGAYVGGWMARFIPSPVLLMLFACIMFATAWAMLRNGHRLDRPSRPRGRLSFGKVVLLGLAVGTVSGLVGAGGGFLVVPALTLLGGLPLPLAIGTSLLVISLNTSAGFLGYLTHVQVDYRLAAVVAGSATVGSFLGSWLTHRIPARHLRKSFAWFVVLMACYILYREHHTIGPSLRDLWTHLEALWRELGQWMATQLNECMNLFRRIKQWQ